MIRKPTIKEWQMYHNAKDLVALKLISSLKLSLNYNWAGKAHSLTNINEEIQSKRETSKINKIAKFVFSIFGKWLILLLEILSVALGKE